MEAACIAQDGNANGKTIHESNGRLDDKWTASSTKAILHAASTGMDAPGSWWCFYWGASTFYFILYCFVITIVLASFPYHASRDENTLHTSPI